MNLLTQIYPRLVQRERFLGHNVKFTWKIPDTQSGALVIPGTIAQIVEDRTTRLIRLYDWRTKP